MSSSIYYSINYIKINLLTYIFIPIYIDKIYIYFILINQKKES